MRTKRCWNHLVMSPQDKLKLTQSKGTQRMLVTMSDKELHRLPVIQAVCEKRLRRRDAASQLGISERQAQRLINRYPSLFDQVLSAKISTW